MLAIAPCLHLEVKHIDLTSAFLHENYTGPTTLYIEPLPSFDGKIKHPGKVAKIVKNIYGTPNAPRIFSDGMRRHLLRAGDQQIQSDRNIYIKRRGTELLIMAVTIGDFGVATNSNVLYKDLIHDLRTKYHVKDLGKHVKLVHNM